MDAFDPAATLGADDPLQQWLKDPAAADFVKQKALEHAQSVLGFTDPTGTNIDPNSGMPTDDRGSAPMWTPMSKAKDLIGANPDPTANMGPVTLNPSGVRSASDPTPNTPPPINPLDPVETAGAGESVPLPRSRPKEAGPGASDISAQKKKEKEDATSDLMKTLSGLKPIAPPPLNPVGTPSVRSPTATNAPQLSQILQLMGQSGQASPGLTLGRLLVAGKA